MAGLESRQVGEALAALASTAEPQAAGVACAVACAAAAALVELTAGLAAARTAAEGTGEGDARAQSTARLRALATRAHELRQRLFTAADDDARAYARVANAADGAARAQALSEASDPPLTIAECAAEVAEAATETAAAGAWGFRADAVVAGQLAGAAARGAAELVAVNLAGAPDDPRTARAQEAAGRAESASRAAAKPSAN